MVGIYKITNLVNGKVYIGQSKNITVRWENHKSLGRCTNESNSYLHNAMRKYGVENFKKEVLEECRVDELNIKEIQYIQEYDSMNREKGYNQLPGGQHTVLSNEMTVEIVKEITSHLLDNKLTMKQISDIYGLSEDTISNINVGRRWRRDDIDYPIRKNRAGKAAPDKEELLHKLKYYIKKLKIILE